MIVSALINLFTSLFGFFVGLMPDAALPAGLTGALQHVGGYVGMFAWLFPVDAIYNVVVFGIFIEGTIFLSKWGFWLYNKIRGSG